MQPLLIEFELKIEDRMTHKSHTRAPLLILVIFLVALSLCCAQNRDLAEIQYRFTPCGTSGCSGPSFSACQAFYGQINSPIAQQNLLFEFENREYEGVQGFRVPKNGLYNITIAAGSGGRGICNSEYGGHGFQRTVQVELSTEYELLILVGQRGVGPCDVIPEAEEAYNLFCREPPATLMDAEACNETWYNFTRESDFDRVFYEAFGGGAGGGGSLVRARRKDTKVIDNFPIVIVGGGGGSSSILDYDATETTSASTTFLPSKVLSYRTYINGKASQFPAGATFIDIGVRGDRTSSSNTVAGAGGGYRTGFLRPINEDGMALIGAHNFAEGGLDCTESFATTGHVFPYSGVHGGFGGGGGACGGGGGGGGYTGGAILDAGLTIPGGGGYSYVGDDFGTSFSVHEVDQGRLSERREDGFVEIVLADCGCVHMCRINSTDDTFECLCPNNTTLAPDLNDCYESTTLSVNEGPLNVVGSGLHYKFIELENSAYILSNDMYIRSNGEMCVLFWLGEDLRIMLSTPVVRGSGRMSTLVVVDDDAIISSPILSTMLTSSVLVTGALLVGTGDCTVVGDSISVSASIQTTSSANVSAEDFFNRNTSAVEQRAGDLAVVFFLEQNTATVLTDSGFGRSSAVIIAPTVAVFLLLLLVVAVFITIGTFIACRHRSKRTLRNESGTPMPIARYQDCLVLNMSYSSIDVKSPSRLQDSSPYYHKVPDFLPEDESASSFSSEAEIIPVHGVTCPQHDFTIFNKKRRNTMIADTVWDYPRGNLMYMRELGEGQFGKVLLMKAKDIAGYSGHIPVAVKTLTSRDPKVIKKFHEEASLMIKFSHPNIVSLLSFIKEEKDEDSAPLMVLEFMQYGDLASFMRSHRPVDGQQSAVGESKFIAFAADVARGLEFLSSMRYVHRDVAARNCLVGTGLRIKIADFGLVRAVHNKDYYKVGGAAVLPVRWMAPESLLFGFFNLASDVWSYGVLLWEIVSYGETPLGDTSVDDIIDAAQNRILYHTRPPNCPDSLSDLMSECLEHSSERRPAATDIVVYLDKLNNEAEKGSNNDIFPTDNEVV